jgi:hypothetical protein
MSLKASPPRRTSAPAPRVDGASGEAIDEIVRATLRLPPAVVEKIGQMIESFDCFARSPLRRGEPPQRRYPA